MQRLLRRVVDKSVAVVFVGNAIRADVDHFPKRYRTRARVIPNAVEVAPRVDRAAVRARFGLAADAFVVLAVGALTDQKNHKVLVQALGSVPEATLVLAGDGPLRNDLESLAVSTGARVTVLGHIPPDDVLELYGPGFSCSGLPWKPGPSPKTWNQNPVDHLLTVSSRLKITLATVVHAASSTGSSLGFRGDSPTETS